MKRTLFPLLPCLAAILIGCGPSSQPASPTTIVETPQPSSQAQQIQAYVTAANGTLGYYKLNAQSGAFTSAQPTVVLPASAQNAISRLQVSASGEQVFISIPSTDGHQAMIADRNRSNGQLSLRSEALFPAAPFENATVAPSGQFAYAVRHTQRPYGEVGGAVDFLIYKRGSDGKFQEVSRSKLGDWEEFAIPSYDFQGFLQADGRTYLKVASGTYGHPGILPALSLWRISPSGDSVDAKLAISSADDAEIVSASDADLILASDHEGANGISQRIAKVEGGDVQLLANCDASAAKCPYFASAAMATSHRFAYAVTAEADHIVLVQWSTSTRSMTFTELPVTSVDLFTDVFVDPTGQFLLASSGIGKMSVYRIDAANGNLSEVAGSPFNVSGRIVSMAFATN